MSIEFWEFMDTVAKIGLGAAIAGGTAYATAKLKHLQAVEQAAVRRRLEVIEEITAGVAEFGNTVARYCILTENMLNAIYRQDGTIGEPLPSQVMDRGDLGNKLQSGSALEQPEGLLYLVSGDAVLPKALSDLQRFAEEVLNCAGQDVQDIDPQTLNRKLGTFRLQATFLMGELGKVYRKPTI